MGGVINLLSFEEIVTIDGLVEKCGALKKRHFRPGFDGMTAEAASLWIQVNGKRLLEDMRAHRYRPMPAMGFTVAKLSGSYRQLSRLAARDSAIQLCLLSALSDFCEGFFSKNSYAYRSGLGTGAALTQFCALGNQYFFAAKVDPVACYDNMDRTVLRTAIQSHIPMDDTLSYIIDQYIEMPVLVEGVIETKEIGILQGAPLSPLLCNLYFHALDVALKERGIPYVRYADDIVIFGKTLDEAQQSMDFVVDMLVNRLKLKPNDRKYSVGASADLQYLGHRFMRDRRGFIALKTTDSPQGAFHSWHQQKMRNTHKTMDVLSDGVLRQKDYSLYFDGETQDYDIPLMSIDMLNIYSSVIFDAGFLEKALEYGIYINLFDRHGHLTGRFVPNGALKAPVVTHEQLKAYYDEAQRLALAKQFVLAAIHNARIVIRYYNKQGPNDVYALSLGSINHIADEIKACEDYNRLMLLEAQAKKEYYGCFDFFIKSDAFFFEKRTRKPPENEINAMISFGNTVLYNMIAFKINKSPLDIRIGFLHATNGFRKESLNLDVAEIFKPLIVDRVILSMVNLRTIRPEHFYREKDGAVYLNAEGKRLFLKGLYQKLDEGVTVEGRRMTYDMLMNEEVRKLTRRFRSDETYKAYRQVR